MFNVLKLGLQFNFILSQNNFIGMLYSVHVTKFSNTNLQAASTAFEDAQFYPSNQEINFKILAKAKYGQNYKLSA